MRIERAEFEAQSIEELKTTIGDLKAEMLRLRQSKQAQTLQPEEMRDGRKNLARALSVLNLKERAEALEKYKNAKRIPKQLRKPCTKRERAKLTKKQLMHKVRSVRYREKKYPKQIFSYSE
ncbi:60S ribosomal protein L35-2 [Astathelohania contejeani]|uniref:60S ribosomal protein L35-2 n=1 Tax=Astathelohania contejeani TaxID=164912 RepID=A0ABQ7HXE2_9MICR|nr:60S ribosomal protein L35-2 [Thelohania contejeani]